jgi:hypothetical protein
VRHSTVFIASSVQLGLNLPQVACRALELLVSTLELLMGMPKVLLCGRVRYLDNQFFAFAG